jgi:hypothetical protein
MIAIWSFVLAFQVCQQVGAPARYQHIKPVCSLTPMPGYGIDQEIIIEHLEIVQNNIQCKCFFGLKLIFTGIKGECILFDTALHWNPLKCSIACSGQH